MTAAAIGVVGEEMSPARTRMLLLLASVPLAVASWQLTRRLAGRDGTRPIAARLGYAPLDRWRPYRAPSPTRFERPPIATLAASAQP